MKRLARLVLVACLPAFASTCDYTASWIQWANPGIGPSTNIIVSGPISPDSPRILELEVMYHCRRAMCATKAEVGQLLPGMWVTELVGVVGVTDVRVVGERN